MQLSLRLETSVVERAEALAPLISPENIMLMRSDVLRAAMIRGIEIMEHEVKSKRSRRRS